MRRRTLLAALPMVVISGYSLTKMGDANGVYEVTDFSFEFETEAPEYVVKLEGLASQVDDDESVVHIDDLPSKSKAMIKDVIERRRYETDRIPTAVESVSSNYDYVRCDECDRERRYFDITVVNTQVGPRERLEFGAAVTDEYVSMNDPADIEFTITNPSSRRMTVSSGVVPPFGVLTADVESGDQDLVLWNDVYVESEGVSTDLGMITGKTKQEISTVLRPGERRAETYQIRLRDYLPFVRAKDTPPTQFVVDGNLKYSPGNVSADLHSEYAVRFDIVK